MSHLFENREELNKRILNLSLQICGNDRLIQEKIAGYIALRIDEAVIDFSNTESSFLLDEEEYETEIEKIRQEILSDVILDDNKKYSIDNLTDVQAIKICNSLEKEYESLQKEKSNAPKNKNRKAVKWQKQNPKPNPSTKKNQL